MTSFAIGSLKSLKIENLKARVNISESPPGEHPWAMVNTFDMEELEAVNNLLNRSLFSALPILR
jgi:hypothetical protein